MESITLQFFAKWVNLENKIQSFVCGKIYYYKIIQNSVTGYFSITV